MVTLFPDGGNGDVVLELTLGVTLGTWHLHLCLRGHHSEQKLVKGQVQHPSGPRLVWAPLPSWIWWSRGYKTLWGALSRLLPEWLQLLLEEHSLHCGKQNATELRQTSDKLNRIAKPNGSEKALGGAGELQLKVYKTEHNCHQCLHFMHCSHNMNCAVYHVFSRWPQHELKIHNFCLYR